MRSTWRRRKLLVSLAICRKDNGSHCLAMRIRWLCIKLNSNDNYIYIRYLFISLFCSLDLIKGKYLLGFRSLSFLLLLCSSLLLLLLLDCGHLNCTLLYEHTVSFIYWIIRCLWSIKQQMHIVVSYNILCLFFSLNYVFLLLPCN